DRTVQVKLPPGKYLSQRLSITVGPNVQATFIQVAASPEGYGWGQPLTDTVVQRLLCLVNGLGYLPPLNRGDLPGGRRRATELEATVARLVATQLQDGGWTWTLAQPVVRSTEQAARARASGPRVNGHAVA